MSLYDCLGVEPSASTEDINAAYRKAAKAHHPDAGGDPDAFARVSHAVAILRDPERRAEYDRSGKEDFREDNPDGRAIAIVSQDFGAALQAFAEGQMPSTQDLMAVVRRNLSESLRNQRSELQKASAAQLRNRDARERLIHKGAGPDILGRMLADQADNIAKAIAAMEGIEADIARAIEMAADWDWRPDEVPTYQTKIWVTPGSSFDTSAAAEAVAAEMTAHMREGDLFSRMGQRHRKGGML